MIDPYKSTMAGEVDRAREVVKQNERRLGERELLRDAPARPGILARIRRALSSLRRSR